MLKIGDFSKLSHLTVKALRFYEKEGLLKPASVDEWNNYRFYETSQLETAARIRSYRQLGGDSISNATVKGKAGREVEVEVTAAFGKAGFEVKAGSEQSNVDLYIKIPGIEGYIIGIIIQSEKIVPASFVSGTFSVE